MDSTSLHIFQTFQYPTFAFDSVKAKRPRQTPLTSTESATLERVRPLAVTAVVTLLAAGCDGQHLLHPNGKEQVLMFDVGIGILGEGLARDIILPREETLVRGCGKIDPVCEVKTFRYDFDGTTLDVSLDSGLRLVEAPLESRGYRLRVSCDAAPTGGQGEVRVRVLAGTAVKYADAFDVLCRRADGMLVDVRPESLDVAEKSPPRALAAAGARILAVGSPWVNSPEGSESLFGLGFTVDGAGGAFAIEDAPPLGASFWLDALSPGGSGAVIHAGTISAPLPVEAIPDDGWTLALATRACSFDQATGKPASLPSVKMSVSGRTAAGEYVGVPRQGCDYTFTGSDRQVHSLPGLHCFDQCIDAAAGGQLCAMLGGRIACATVDANGESH